MKKQFKITGEYIELIKLLKAVGLAQTGGQAKLIVENGEVQVDGEVELRKRRKLYRGMTVLYDTNHIEVV